MDRTVRAKDAVTGVLTRDEFRELVDAPFGKARKEIQKRDPFWGRSEGDKIEFEVRVSSWCEGRAFVKAASQEEADKLADDLSNAEIDWEYDSDDYVVLSVEPYVQRK